MLEGHVIAGTPRELRAETGIDALLDVALGLNVADFLLTGLEGLHAGVELDELKHREGWDVTDVAHGLKLVQVLGVMHEVEHEVVLHGNVEGLHLLGLGATSLADSALNGVLGLHERLVLGLDLVNDAWGVDRVTVIIPVDRFQLSGGLISVVVIKESLQLTMGVTGILVRGCCTKSLQPDACQVLACSIVTKNLG